MPEDLPQPSLVLCCFVTERKHRDWNRTPIWAFRNVEHQSTFDSVNYCVREFVSSRFVFEQVYVDNHQRLVDPWSVSWQPITRAGHVRRGGVVVVTSRGGAYRVCECLRVGQREDDVPIELVCYERISRDEWEYGTYTSDLDVCPASGINVRCAHAPARKHVVHVLVQFCIRPVRRCKQQERKQLRSHVTFQHARNRISFFCKTRQQRRQCDLTTRSVMFLIGFKIVPPGLPREVGAGAGDTCGDAQSEVARVAGAGAGDYAGRVGPDLDPSNTNVWEHL